MPGVSVNIICEFSLFTIPFIAVLVVCTLFAIAAIFTTGFPFTLLYIVLAFILPEDNGEIDTDVSKKD